MDVPYKAQDIQAVGSIYYPKKRQESAPAVLIAHTWRGKDNFTEEAASHLTRLGYIAFAVDLYGDGRIAQNDEEAASLMKPLFLDRSLLQKRIAAGLEVLLKQPGVNPQKVGAIGFCFGGLAVIELLRSGKLISGAVSFHAVLANNLADHQTKTVPISENAKGSLLVLHGNDDPLVSEGDLTALKNEMSKAGIDWQLHIFGNTMHAFTNPKAHFPDKGLLYNKTSAKRAWLAMDLFFDEVFK